ncbi:MAG: hypothetical protein DHS20C15_23980 [Planctomycetota bacterium]|nr:MAG: hypothetical protein DHS20C15_23980 [Planctomycetota bacterium]
MTRLTLLGPQRRNPCVAHVIKTRQESGRVAVVTAGWEERESELDEMRAHLGEHFETVGLGLCARAEQLFHEDPELLTALQAHSDQRLRLLELYRLRLDHAADSVYALLADVDEARAELSRLEADDALRAVQALDARNLQRISELQARFDERWSPETRPAFADARAEIAERLAACDVLAIAGGHVGVLLDRLHLFGIRALIGERLVVAWSAGAMACTERVLLFHDSPPQGRGHAEMYAPGLALAPGLVALPHARTRLALHDLRRVSALARRCAPATCVCLDEGSRADWDGKAWSIAPGTRWMTAEGTLAEHAVGSAAT